MTLIEFSSARGCGLRYLQEIASSTLELCRRYIQALRARVPGAIEADGTKAYSGEYTHAVVAATKNFYFQVAYANAAPPGPRRVLLVGPGPVGVAPVRWRRRRAASLRRPECLIRSIVNVG